MIVHQIHYIYAMISSYDYETRNVYWKKKKWFNFEMFVLHFLIALLIYN